MKKYLLSSALLFTAVAVGSFLARHNGWYNSYWLTDIILHTTSGVALGCAWIGLQEKDRAVPWFAMSIGVISVATFGSVLWEFWEFAGWLLTKAQVPFYTPALSDTLGDIACGMIGGLASSFLLLLQQKKENA